MIAGAGGSREGCHLARAERDRDGAFRPAGLARWPSARDAKRVTLDESGQELFVEVERSIVVKLQQDRALD
jgi:hypothetical protein